MEDEVEEEEVNQFLLRGITQEEMTLNLQYQERLRLAWQTYLVRNGEYSADGSFGVQTSNSWGKYDAGE